jgi:GTP:adenosylcobinamide-phosphate guanylyltransferase
VDAVIMAGGQGTRMGTSKKMLLKINGKPVIDIVLEVLQQTRFRISLCISGNTGFLEGYGNVRILKGTGNYAEDLKYALDMCSMPVLVVPADALFSPDILTEFTKKARGFHKGIATLLVNGKISGISMFFENPKNEELPYTNIKIIHEGFFNLNYPEDYKKAMDYFEK